MSRVIVGGEVGKRSTEIDVVAFASYIVLHSARPTRTNVQTLVDAA